MSVVNQVILHVSVVHVLYLGVVAVAVQDIAGAQVMVEGVTALVTDLLDAEVCHQYHVVVATAGHHHHIVAMRRCRMPTETGLGIDAGAGAECSELVYLALVEYGIKYF